MLMQAPRGTRDILPPEVYKWQYLEDIIHDLCRNYGYEEIRLPVFEHTELFKRGVGDTTDIVQKEMYTFEDKAGRSLTLRPEGTAGVVRSYIQNGMASWTQPVKLYYLISAYRYENVQKGRYREFNQFGVEAFGAPGPSIDIEIISMLDNLFENLGIGNLRLCISSLGCIRCREAYNKALRGYLESRMESMCAICRKRYETNPMRIIDCKTEKCTEITALAPAPADHICNDCREHFDGVRAGLENIGIDYSVDKTIVRGLDYYTRTVFEFISANVGTQGTVCGGGRYDNLIENCGGKPSPGMGFGLGIERLLMELESQGIKLPGPDRTDIYIATLGTKAEMFAHKLVHTLRKQGVRAEKDHMKRSIRAQMKHANKMNAGYSIVIGDEELGSNKAILRSMETGEEKDVSIDSIPERFKKQLKQSKQ